MSRHCEFAISCVVLLVACGPVLAQPVPKPEATFGPALREISGWGLHLTGQALDLLSNPRIFWVLDSNELALRLRAAVMAADEINQQLAKVAALKGAAHLAIQAPSLLHHLHQLRHALVVVTLRASESAG
ncbi:MAG: hypothetical protein U0792_09830 [Gemmataceae bacterium]